MNSRLPKNYIPIHYSLYLHITDGKYPFDASVSIIFQKNQKDERLFLNVESSICIKKITQNKIDLKYSVEYPILTIEQTQAPDIDFDTYPITIEYTVLPSDHFNQGLFILNGSYITDFEPNYARKLLPCFDDPCIRSTFSVKLLIPSNLKALSNMPAETVETIENEKMVTFSKTPAMCTYLLCICVGTFSGISAVSANGTKVNFFTITGHEQNLKNSLDEAIYAVNWMENKFGVKYELSELQLIAIDGFPAGMENYGLITLRDCTDSINKLFNTNLIFHEIIHQWFGDLVSIEYWNSLWLNEGFAEFIQYLILNDYKPNRNAFLMFSESEGFRCFDYFDDENALCPSEDDVIFQTLFSALIYSKGSFVVKMFYDWIGEPLFYKVCSEYLNKFKNKTVVVEDFISVASSVLQKDMMPFFDPWLHSYGFPILNVEEIEVDSQKVGITISQICKNDECSFMFKLPILYEKDGIVNKKVIDVVDFEMKIDIEFDWIIVNDDLAALCFVLYSKNLLEALKKPNDEKKISSLNKSLILDSTDSKIASFLVDDEKMELIKSICN